MLDYYRGSSSYEDAVKNRLNALEVTGIATTQAVRNLESGFRSEIQATRQELESNRYELQGLRSDFQSAAVGMYQMGQGFRNDIQDMAFGVTSAIQANTYAVVASQQMLANTFTHGFNAVNNTLNFGFGLVGNKIDVLSEEISSRLDEIQDILNNPRLTQSRELYREALRSYRKGFYEEALEDCLGAIEKNKTDYISWYLLGLIYLYGAGENGNVIDLDKAEEAFSNAAKYIKLDIAKSEEAKLFASDIYYNLGFSRLAKSNDYLVENKVDDSNTKLLEAENASATAYQLSKENLIAGYEHVKELHFLGKDDEALYLLEELIRKEKNYAIKAINDKNFESLWDKIKCLILKLRDEVAEKIMHQCNDFRTLYGIKHRQNKYSRIKFPTESQINEFETFYNSEFIENNFAPDSNLSRKAQKEFNILAKDLLSKDKTDIRKLIDVMQCNIAIENIRKGRTSTLEELEETSLLIEKTLAPFESELNKDYFFVLQKDREFNGKKNQKRLRELSSNIINKYKNLDKVLETMALHAETIHSYLAAQKEWNTRKLELREKYISEITENCRCFHTSWKNRIEEMKNNLEENYLSVKLPEIMSNTKSILADELELVSSRIEDVFNRFDSIQEKDYFFVLERYIKFNEIRLSNYDSYFEYTLSNLYKEIKAFKDTALDLMEAK